VVVLDAGVVLALFTPDPGQAAAQAQYRSWVTGGEERHAPAVMPYEVMNVLARLLWDGTLTSDDADVVWANVGGLGITVHPFNLGVDGPRSLEIAQVLKRRHATDCSYVTLAEQLGAEVWTLDGPFARAAQAAGFPVRLVTEGRSRA